MNRFRRISRVRKHPYWELQAPANESPEDRAIRLQLNQAFGQVFGRFANLADDLERRARRRYSQQFYAAADPRGSIECWFCHTPVPRSDLNSPAELGYPDLAPHFSLFGRCTVCFRPVFELKQKKTAA